MGRRSLDGHYSLPRRGRTPTGDMAGLPSPQDSSDLMPIQDFQPVSTGWPVWEILCSWGEGGSTALLLRQDEEPWHSCLGAMITDTLISDTQRPMRLTGCDGQNGRQPSLSMPRLPYPYPQSTLGRHRLDWGGTGSQGSTMRSLRSELGLWVGVRGYSPRVLAASV